MNVILLFQGFFCCVRCLQERVYGQAFFTLESAPEFTVVPPVGSLAPKGAAEGTPIEVCFLPREYGKPLTAVLVIQVG